MAAPQQPPAQTFSKLITLKSVNSPPPPAPKVEGPTPDHEFESYVENQKQRQVQAEADVARAKEEAVKTKSMFGKITSTAKGLANSAGDVLNKGHDSVEKSARDQLFSRQQAQFAEHFPELAASSKFLAAYGCKAMHNGQKVDGSINVCSTAISFYSKAGIKEVIALKDIATIVPSVALPTSRAMNGAEDGPPFILPLPHPSVLGDTIQLFTTGNQIFQFLQFDNMLLGMAQHLTASIKTTAYEQCYNWLDHAWRDAVTVPLPGVIYSA
ncbi:hypothetical protein DIPPA_07782 [Diplonema papillatum]|nr:hypothetical protein DIPPA_07782 [Diplonema papillatum]KAJ9445796.1 hypothetical protein DIPPA_07782 [Diplonema papillatum]